MFECLKNCTPHGKFHLLAFSGSGEMQIVFFTVILLMFVMAVLGNLVITILVCLVVQLQTPMYFFLCNLSVQDIIYVSAILPNVLAITITGDNSISFPSCVAQMFFFIFCAGTEFFLLTSMAYDRYVAICLPLNYILIMNKKLCILLVTVCWLLGISNSLTHALLISNLSFCSIRNVDHIYCDLKKILKLSSSDISIIETVLSVEWVFLGLLPFMLIMTSYVRIISTILKIRTSKGRSKAFSSCSSHLTIVFLSYGTCLSFYAKPASKDSTELDKLLSLLYIAVVPMLNPFVYSLRNQDVLRTIRHMKHIKGQLQAKY
ncbi:olfactory receptor 1J2-like [Pelodytes ibericus]